MMFLLPVSLAIFSLLILVLFVLVFFVLPAHIARVALEKLGLSPFMAFLILVLSLVGSTINIPLFAKTAHGLIPVNDFFSLVHPWQAAEMPGKQIIAINVGGALIPILLCIYLLPKTPVMPAFFATAISVMVCHGLAQVVPGKGIVLPAFIPPIVAVILAFIFSPRNKIPVAYISGVLGVLIGADLLNMGNLGGYQGVMSIGGAGVFDGIFLVGIISALLA